jgi:predicted RNA-binding protein with PIN domain
MAFEKHLLVDVANVLHAWPELRALLNHDRNAARSQLFKRIEAVHDVEQVRVTLVVDGRGRELVIEHPSGQSTLTMVYTPSSLTADDVIEQMVGRSADPTTCEVATGDQAERNTIEATGAIWVPVEELRRRIERAEQRLSAKVAGLKRVNAREWRDRHHD